MNQVVFDVVLSVIGLICFGISAYLIPLLRAKYTAEQLQIASEWTKKAVACAEIIFNIPKSGEQKKEYVVNYLNGLFNSKKEVISSDQLEILIEAAVKQLKMSSVTTGDAHE